MGMSCRYLQDSLLKFISGAHSHSVVVSGPSSGQVGEHCSNFLTGELILSWYISHDSLLTVIERIPSVGKDCFLWCVLVDCVFRTLGTFYVRDCRC